MNKLLILLLIIFTAIAVDGQAQQNTAINNLYRDFVRPPAEAKPRTWWHWTGSNITREGITKDLEWMSRVGIGGFMLFDVSLGMGQQVADKKIFFSPEWLEMLKHATREADRLGLEMTMHSSAGWSETGGPWVKPREAVKKLVWSEQEVPGGLTFTGKLPLPPSTIGPIRNMKKARSFGAAFEADPIYVDARVVAYRLPEGEAISEPPVPRARASFGPIDAAPLLDDDLQTAAALAKPKPDQPTWIQYEYDRPVTFRAFSIALQQGGWASSAMRPGSVQVSDDGQNFSTIVTLPGAQHDIRGLPVRTFSFPATTARFFRITFRAGAGITTVGGPDEGRFANPSATTFDVLEAKFHTGARVNRWEDKANFTPLFDFTAVATPAFPPAATIPKESVIDLTGKMKPDGSLSWNAPAGGRWTIMRMGYSLTGAINSPAVAAGTGLEVDKLSREHLASYYRGYTEKIKSTLGDLYGKRMQYFLVDSYEADAQNWTDRMIEEFSRRRGYNPTPYLPVLTGRVVENAEVSDRFLWDFRRTIADLLAEDHYEAFADLAHAEGVKVYSEAAGISMPVIQDALLNKSKVDIPMGEFGMTQGLSVASSEWLSAADLQKVHAYRGAADRMNAHWADVREAASAVHIYGKRIVAAESWTGGGFEAPAALKPIGDYWNTQGINRFIFHTSTHQPLDTKPGNAMVGAHFHRNITWAELAGPFMDYVARNSFLLQQGQFVADIAYFLGESIPSAVPYWKNLEPAPPEGYDYDFLNTEILLEQLSVRNGRLILPSGMEYEVLVLPDSREMTPQVLSKIRQLVSDGATVIGPKPLRSPSLQGYPEADDQVAIMAGELWGDCDGQLIFHHAYGAGHVYWGIGLEGILAEKEVGKDVEYTRPNFNTQINWIHRRIDNVDLYFLSNQRQHSEKLRIAFRVSGRKPEIWRPDTGQREPVGYTMDAEKTIIRLDLEANESVFVVFGEPTRQLSLDLRPGTERIVKEISGSWEVVFMPQLGAPDKIIMDQLHSWTENERQGVKYYSGTATYLKEFSWAGNTPSAGERLVLDLGKVRDIAEVLVNGKRIDLLWKPPYRSDISSALVAGNNRLEVRITNQWNNRIAGDRKLPEDQRILSGAGFSFGGGGGNAPLEESGLLGPVVIRSISQ